MNASCSSTHSSKTGHKLQHKARDVCYYPTNELTGATREAQLGPLEAPYGPTWTALHVIVLWSKCELLLQDIVCQQAHGDYTREWLPCNMCQYACTQ